MSVNYHVAVVGANTSTSFTRGHQTAWQKPPEIKTARSQKQIYSEIVKYFIDTALSQLPESKHNVQQKLYQLQTPVEECTDSDALNAAVKHL